MFSTCSTISSPKDVQMFFDAIASSVSGVVQYNRDNVNYQPMDITQMCSIIETGADPLQAVANFNDAVNKFNNASCTEVSYQVMIDQLSVTGAGRCWTYQTCTEFGFFQTGESSSQPFAKNITLKFFTDMCADLFSTSTRTHALKKNLSPPLAPNTEWTNTFYGARNVAVSNVFLPAG